MKQPEPPGSGQVPSRIPDITPLLAVLQPLYPISPEIENYLKEHLTVVTVRKRKMLLKEGTVCEHMYFVVKGAIRGFVREGHRDISTWITVENQLVSSIFGLNKRSPSAENIQALENCELLAMTLDDLETLYERYPESNILARKLLQIYYADAERRAFIARLTKAENKYRHLLLHHQHLSNRIPLKYIASYLGMTLETLSRVRKKFSSKP
jgi:CRP-like cAMP-binding protein